MKFSYKNLPRRPSHLRSDNLQVVGVSLDVDSLNGEDLVVLRLETGGSDLVGAQSASKSGVRLIQDHGRINVLCTISSAFELGISKNIWNITHCGQEQCRYRLGPGTRLPSPSLGPGRSWSTG